jgi:hypothetical protein
MSSKHSFYVNRKDTEILLCIGEIGDFIGIEDSLYFYQVNLDFYVGKENDTKKLPIKGELICNKDKTEFFISTAPHLRLNVTKDIYWF